MNRTLSEWLTFFLQAETASTLVLHKLDVEGLRQLLEDLHKRVDAPAPEPKESNCYNCTGRIDTNDMQVCRGCYRELESIIDAVKDATAGY